MCKALWRRAEALKLMGNHSTAIGDYEKISQCRSDRWSHKGVKWMMELGTSHWEWGERSAKITRKLKKIHRSKCECEKEELWGEIFTSLRIS